MQSTTVRSLERVVCEMAGHDPSASDAQVALAGHDGRHRYMIGHVEFGLFKMTCPGQSAPVA